MHVSKVKAVPPRCGELLFTQFTGDHLPRMATHDVILQVDPSGKTAVAVIALVTEDPTVLVHMDPIPALGGERFAAYLTAELVSSLTPVCVRCQW